MTRLAGADLHAISRSLLDAIDPDVVEAEASRRGPLTEATLDAAGAELKEQAIRVFDDPKLRRLLCELKQQSEIVIDEISTDEVLSADYDLRRATETDDEIPRVPGGEQGRVDGAASPVFPALCGATAHLSGGARAGRRARPAALAAVAAGDLDGLQAADQGRVRDASPERLLTDLVMLVRYALGLAETLEPFSVGVEQRFNLWLGREKKAGRDYTDAQMAWLRLLKDHIAANVEVGLANLQEAPSLADRGGRDCRDAPVRTRAAAHAARRDVRSVGSVEGVRRGGGSRRSAVGVGLGDLCGNITERHSEHSGPKSEDSRTRRKFYMLTSVRSAAERLSPPRRFHVRQRRAVLVRNFKRVTRCSPAFVFI